MTSLPCSSSPLGGVSSMRTAGVPLNVALPFETVGELEAAPEAMRLDGEVKPRGHFGGVRLYLSLSLQNTG